ncbi:MAG: prepilin-type N-terminal cleavage/methylation domain-containing protein [Polyangiaceae bacterium]
MRPLLDHAPFGRIAAAIARKILARRALARRPRKSDRGFTLVELLVSLTAGLLVAIGVVGLSREATTTFYEEERAATAELSLRVAIDRLRSDLGHAAHMSTGNLARDPLIAGVGGAAYSAGMLATFPGLAKLGSVKITENANASQVAQSVLNGLHPQRIEISGNFTTADAFAFDHYLPNGGPNGCTRFFLTNDQPIIWRIKQIPSDADRAAALSALFSPVPSSATAAPQFMVRIADEKGRYQYLATCPGAPAGFVTATEPFVDVAAQTPVIVAVDGQPGGLGGFGGASGRAMLNPVQTVRWDIGTGAAAGFGASADSKKYDLHRTWVGADGQPVGTPEVVAEYAVDLRFALSVDDSALDTGAAPHMVHLAYTNPDNWEKYAIDTPGNALTNQGPHRIRAIRFRVATRTQTTDRAADLPTNVAEYLYRYCAPPGSATECTPNARHWARVRTLSGEIALLNQSRFFYP